MIYILIALKCPNCGGNIKFDDSLIKGFCMYCGTEIINESNNQSIKIDRTDDVINYLKLVKLMAEEHNWLEMNQYIDKIIEINMDISDIWYAKAIINYDNQQAYNRCIEKANQCITKFGIIKEDDIEKLYGFKVLFLLEDGFVARNYSDVIVNIDGTYIKSLIKGSFVQFGLLKGNHTILIEGHSAGATIPRYIRNNYKFNVYSDKTIIIHFKKLSFGYVIEEKY